MAFRKLPSPLTVLMLVIVIAAIATWVIPAGKFNTIEYSNGSLIYHQQDKDIILPATQSTLDSLRLLIKIEKFADGSFRKPVSVPGTYHKLNSNRQNVLNIVQAPIKGIYDSFEVILFVLFIGGFINVFYSSGALEKGLQNLSNRMKGKEAWLLVVLGFLLSFGGSSFGMAEEGFAFYPILVPIFLAAGYDLLVPVAIIFGGNQLGTLSSFSNPFATIIASNAAGINWGDGLIERLIVFGITTVVYIWYIVRYAQKVKKDPTKSLVYQIDKSLTNPFATNVASPISLKSDARTNILIALFLLSFLTMIGGVIFLEWWLLEMTTVFLVAALVIAVVLRMNDRSFIDRFLKGAESLLGVAFIIGVARGVTIILNEGNISDTIVYYAAEFVSGMPTGLFLVMVMIVYMLFTLFISSTSGMAVVTMPIMSQLAVLTGVPGREIVNAYLYGMGIMGMITPTGLLLPSLALTNTSFKAWFKFIWPLLIILLVLCSVFLIVGGLKG